MHTIVSYDNPKKICEARRTVNKQIITTTCHCIKHRQYTFTAHLNDLNCHLENNVTL